MVRGFELFRRYFKGFKDEYVIIGGTACEILMNENGLGFRVTKDLDVVLIAEMKNPRFTNAFGHSSKMVIMSTSTKVQVFLSIIDFNIHPPMNILL